MVLRRIFQSGGAKERRAFTLQLNAVRLGDLALHEYALGREASLGFHRDRKGLGVTFVLRASGHFENCVLSLERFVKHIKALRGASFAHPDLKRLMPRDFSLLRPSVESQIVGMRHLLAHLEEKAVRGELSDDTSVALLATSDGLCLAEQSLTWSNLVAWLQDTHKCASSLADYMGDQEHPV